MQINIIAVGKRMPGWVEIGYNEYAKRLPPSYQVHLREIGSAKRLKDSDIMRLLRFEGEQMLAAIPKGNTVIALDVKGKLWDTYKLANQLKTWHDTNQDISLLIGGPDGLAVSCLDRANLKWSLSPLTFPHPIVRVIVIEQLYRAWSILTHHPYHRS